MKGFDTAPERRGTGCVKWDRKAVASIASNEDALPFWVADMDFYAAEPIIRTASKAASDGVYGYPVFDNLEDIFSSWLRRRHDWDVPAETISLSMGLLHGIAMAIDCFTEKGDRIVIPSPTYKPFRRLCSLSGRIMEELELDYDGASFSLDIEKLEKVAATASMILFCSPHNPTGIVFREDELEAVLEIGKKYGIPIISDEIHADLTHPGKKHIPMGKENGKVGAECITMMAPSKTFNLAGEHAAFAVFSDPDMQNIWKAREEALWLTTPPGVFIGKMMESAYTECDDYNRDLCIYLKRNSDEMENYLSSHPCGIRKVKGDSSFVTLLDCSDIYDRIEKKVLSDPERYKGGEGGGILSRFFGVEASTAMNDGTWFGEQYKAFVRFNYGTNLKSVLDALERMRRAVEKL